MPQLVMCWSFFQYIYIIGMFLNYFTISFWNLFFTIQLNLNKNASLFSAFFLRDDSRSRFYLLFDVFLTLAE